MPPPTIYLDTQDYSKFADVLGDRGDDAVARTMDQLVRLKEQGRVRIACSMPVMVELLQYDATRRDLMLRKATAVELLCGKWAFAPPVSIIAHAVAAAAFEAKLIRTPPDPETVLSERNGWLPSPAGALKGIRRDSMEIYRAELAKLPSANRQQRRASGLSRSALFGRASPDIVDELAKEWPVSRDVIARVITGVMSGRLNEAAAERALNDEMNNPTKFVQLYFERYEGEKDFPTYARLFTGQMHDMVRTFCDQLAPFVGDPAVARKLRAGIQAKAEIVGNRLTLAAKRELERYDINEGLAERLAADDAFLRTVPLFTLLANLFGDYLTSKLRASPSFGPGEGGDILHAMYALHSRYWRTDKQFADSVKRYVDPTKTTVVRLLADLPTLMKADCLT